jgi:hypothetical protein
MTEAEIREIDGKEFSLTPQVWYDAYMMSLPEFVTYYTVTGQYDNRHDLGFTFRELFFELRDRMITESKVDKSLKKSQLRIWLAERDLTLKDLEKDSTAIHSSTKVKQIDSIDQANPLVEKGSEYASKHRPSKEDKQTTPLPKAAAVSKVRVESEIVKPEKIVEVSQGSRLDQVRDLMQQGITSPSKIAAMLNTNASYVQRLKKQIENE